MRPPACGATSIDTAPWDSVNSGPGGSPVSGPGASTSRAIRMQGADAAVGFVLQLGDLDRTQVGHGAGQPGVVGVQPPLSTEAADGVAGGPAAQRGAEHAAVGARAIR